eukprot:8194000-Pyramimonas_sp.AAC.1
MFKEPGVGKLRTSPSMHTRAVMFTKVSSTPKGYVALIFSTCSILHGAVVHIQERSFTLASLWSLWFTVHILQSAPRSLRLECKG